MQYYLISHNAFPRRSSNRQWLSTVDRLETVEDLILQFRLTARGAFDKNMAFSFFNLKNALSTHSARSSSASINAHWSLDPRSISSWVRVACNLVRLSYVDGAGIRNLIEKHIGDTKYNVVDLLKDPKLPNLAGFYPPRRHSAISDEFEEDVPASVPDENMEELMHLMVQTRPDLAYCVSRLAQFMSSPTEQHRLALKRVLRYFQGTRHLGIAYDHAPGNLTMTVWTDSSWGEDPDDSRSTHGYLVFLAGGPVSWKSTKQPSGALSSTEAKYM